MRIDATRAAEQHRGKVIVKQPTWIALSLFAGYVLITFGLRSYVQWRRTGSTGFRGISGSSGSVEWWGGVLLVVAFIAAPVAIALDLAGFLAPIPALASPAVWWLGLGLFLVGFASTFAAQMTMGSSWRIGVKADEVTSLVTHGPFAIVRNPIFSAMLIAALGLALLMPNLVALAAFALALVAIELQVRFVEEPYLMRSHGDAYRRYAAAVGRFVPGVGRLRS